MQRERVSARFGLLLAGALAGLLLFAAPAFATFHLMKVREVYPHGSESYVELQLLEVGEYQVGGHHLVSYNPDGSVADDFTLPSNVSSTSQANATILIAAPGYEAAFPSGPTPDEADSAMNLPAAGGAVCWVEGSPPDCIAWGDFTGPLPTHNPPLAVGSPASPSGVGSGMALRRTIAPYCATFLEARDDSDDSATDFSEQTPNPRDNASGVVETHCVVPETAIDSKPSSPTSATSASFTYHAEEPVGELECKLDEDDFAACPESGLEIPGPLADGSHTFQVRAVTGQGTGVPSLFTWTVDTQPPATSIVSHPENPSSGESAAFTYGSSELGSTFECSLARTGEGDSFFSCPSAGKTYADLADGTYAFKVRATDRAGNRGSTATYSWQVEGSLFAPPSAPAPAPVSVLSFSPPTIAPVTRPAKKKRACRKGFVKRKVRGKARCVRKRQRRCGRHSAGRKRKKKRSGRFGAERRGKPARQTRGCVKKKKHTKKHTNGKRNRKKRR